VFRNQYPSPAACARCSRLPRGTISGPRAFCRRLFQAMAYKSEYVSALTIASGGQSLFIAPRRAW